MLDQNKALPKPLTSLAPTTCNCSPSERAALRASAVSDAVKRIGRVHEESNRTSSGDHLAQHLKSLRCEITDENAHSSEVDPVG